MNKFNKKIEYEDLRAIYYYTEKREKEGNPVTEEELKNLFEFYSKDLDPLEMDAIAAGKKIN